jgi:CRISPR-associated endonuclease/helicase Cas3
MTFYAHTLKGKPPEDWQTLDSHLDEVASLAETYASAFNAGQWGRLAGLLHDLGKGSQEFQEYLLSSQAPDSHNSDTKGRVDHSTAGAQYAVEKLGIAGHLLAYVISGHHAGLLDGRSESACLEARLKKQVPEWRHGEPLPSALELQLPRRGDAFAFAFFTRMLYSCLTDGDFINTEASVDPPKARQRPSYGDDIDILVRMNDCLNRHVEDIEADNTRVNRRRAEVRNDCLAAAKHEPGLFSLTVPTGGGKTLSSLAFALRHAIRHSLHRIIYVIPFTSIIEQNAGEFREVFELLSCDVPDIVVEHHSNLDTEKETTGSRLASENWDAPLVVTTSVQLYESLFACRSSRCRKLHNLARSVIILDEVQTLPVEKLAPCLRALDELVKGYGTTVVLCTATQPAIHLRDELPIGLSGVREIIREPQALYKALRRTEVHDLGRLSDAELCERIEEQDRSLCIVNTRGHARRLYDLLGDLPGTFHLSALMCPAHRSQVLDVVRERLDHEHEPCRVVSTQLIEAGVDIDFPVVFRALAGIDSIAQAAGRCNREGRQPGPGQVFVFRPEDNQAAEGYFAGAAGFGAQILEQHEDPLSLAAVEHYFRLYYWQNQGEWDEHGILDHFNFGSEPKLPFLFDFTTVAKKFKMIDSPMRPVIVPWGDTGEELCEELRSCFAKPGVRLLRKLQRYTVGIPYRVWQRHLGLDIELVAGQYPVLTCPEIHYNETTGLSLDEDQLSFLNG